MSDAEAEGSTTELVLEFALDAPVDKVWRAIETPDLRARWLPGCVPAGPAPSAPPCGREARFTLRDDAPPFAETAVTFQVRPGAEGGSVLRIVHGVPKPGTLARGPAVANGNSPSLLRAA